MKLDDRHWIIAEFGAGVLGLLFLTVMAAIGMIAVGSLIVIALVR